MSQFFTQVRRLSEARAELAMMVLVFGLRHGQIR